MKALIVYGTRYGSTATTSSFLSKILEEQNIETQIVNAKEEKTQDISGYDLVIVGSGMQIDRWTSEPEQFLSKFKRELQQKKVALFVSSGSYSIIEHEGDTKGTSRAQKKYLEEKAEKYSLKPIALGMFGGVWDYNKMGSITRKAMDSYKKRIEAAGFKELTPGFYDTRDWDAIKSWAQKIVAQLSSSSH
jgi:menaquinone-dependent protoporphyrinogen oxidase